MRNSDLEHCLSFPTRQNVSKNFLKLPNNLFCKNHLVTTSPALALDQEP